MVIRGAASSSAPGTTTIENKSEFSLSRPLLREFIWVGPFVCIALMALGLARPTPRFPPPPNHRTAIDAQGIEVPIEEPFGGIILTRGSGTVGQYLSNTRAPETIANVGGPQERTQFGERDLMSKIYPQVLDDDKYWDSKESWALKLTTGVEQFMAHDPGAYLGKLGAFGSVPTLRSVGLPALALAWNARNWEEEQYQTVRVENALIGHPERAEALIARYEQANDDLEQELQPQTITHRVRVLMMGSSSDTSALSVTAYRNVYQMYFLRVGLENAASRELVGLEMDVERILAMDPDLILLNTYGNQGPAEFMRDRRWRGLKAVKERRVYQSFGLSPGGDLVLQPLYNRFMAELAYPDRLQPRMRQLLRDRYIMEFNYRLNDEQIDEMLNVQANKGLPKAERFEKADTSTKEPTQ